MFEIGLTFTEQRCTEELEKYSISQLETILNQLKYMNDDIEYYVLQQERNCFLVPYEVYLDFVINEMEYRGEG